MIVLMAALLTTGDNITEIEYSDLFFHEHFFNLQFSVKITFDPKHFIITTIQPSVNIVSKMKDSIEMMIPMLNGWDWRHLGS